jgi:hypothetical protein
MTKVPAKQLLKMDVYLNIQVVLCPQGGGENGDEEQSGRAVARDDGQTGPPFQTGEGAGKHALGFRYKERFRACAFAI